jgi:hypothetical protein
MGQTNDSIARHPSHENDAIAARPPRRRGWVGLLCAGLASLSTGVAGFVLMSCEQSSSTRGKGALAGTVSDDPSKKEEPPQTPPSYIVSRQGWTLDMTPGELILTPRFKVYTTSTKPFFIDNMPAFLENAFNHYVTSLGPLPAPTRLMEIYLLDTRAQWENITVKFMGDSADTYLRIQKGGFTYDGRAILYDIGRRDTFAITAHEAWHVYTQSTFKNTLPVYFEEGLATFMEGFRWDPNNSQVPTFLPWANFERFDQLRWGVRSNKLMSLKEITVSTPQQLIAKDPSAALYYYAQVWALIHFLSEGEEGIHAPNLRRLVSDAALGKLVPTIREALGDRAASSYAYRRRGVDLLKLYMGKTPEELDVPYRAFIEKIIQTGTRQQIWRGQSPLTAQPPAPPVPAS